MSATPTVELVLSALRARYRFQHEKELQRLLGIQLARAKITYTPEVKLSAEDRIDFLIGTIGVEVKIKGSQKDVVDQLLRYAQHERIGSLILVTTRLQHLVAFPTTLHGKPCTSLYIGSFV